MGSSYVSVYSPEHPRSGKHNRCVYQHVLIAEAALGKFLPEGAVVHHVSGDGKENVRGNLVICQDKNFHQYLHQRTRVVMAGGNPNTQRFCRFCESLFPVGMSVKGHNGRCPSCQRDKQNNWYRALQGLSKGQIRGKERGW